MGHKQNEQVFTERDSNYKQKESARENTLWQEAYTASEKASSKSGSEKNAQVSVLKTKLHSLDQEMHKNGGPLSSTEGKHIHVIGITKNGKLLVHDDRDADKHMVYQLDKSGKLEKGYSQSGDASKGTWKMKDEKLDSDSNAKEPSETQKNKLEAARKEAEGSKCTFKASGDGTYTKIDNRGNAEVYSKGEDDKYHHYHYDKTKNTWSEDKTGGYENYSKCEVNQDGSVKLSDDKGNKRWVYPDDGNTRVDMDSTGKGTSMETNGQKYTSEDGHTWYKNGDKSTTPQYGHYEETERGGVKYVTEKAGESQQKKADDTATADGFKASDVNDIANDLLNKHSWNAGDHLYKFKGLTPEQHDRLLEAVQKKVNEDPNAGYTMLLQVKNGHYSAIQLYKGRHGRQEWDQLSKRSPDYKYGAVTGNVLD
jgi:hypothetical protein